MSRNNGPQALGLIPAPCYELLRPFSLGYFSFTPGILPSALRAGFAVRTRSCACVGQQKKSDSADGSQSKRPLRKRHPGHNATTKRRGSPASPVEPKRTTKPGQRPRQPLPRPPRNMLRHRLTPVSITLHADNSSGAGARGTGQLTIRTEGRGWRRWRFWQPILAARTGVLR